MYKLRSCGRYASTSSASNENIRFPRYARTPGSLELKRY
jgi:hypothetical protein